MSNFSVILHKRTTESGKIPTPASLSAGELAMNTADGKIFLKTVSETIETFSNDRQTSFVLNSDLSGSIPQYGGNTITGEFSNVLGGYNNDVSGVASTTTNGENNDIAGDLSFIGSGYNNTINVSGDYGAILGGKSNTLNHQESFIIGSNITSHLSGFTYVNNLSATEKLYGDGSELTGIVAGDIEATTLVRDQSANWGVGGQPQNLTFNESTKDLSLTYGNTISLSAFGTGSDTEMRSLTSNWQSTSTTVSSNSAVWTYPINLTATVKNVEGATLYKGDVVYSYGAVGDVMSVKKASNTSETTSSKTLGIVNETILDHETGMVILNGPIIGISLGSPFNEGDALWLGSTAGTYTNIKPVAPNHSVYLGVVEKANQGQGIAYVKVQNGYELNEIHDVLLTSISANQILKRNSANTLWINTNTTEWDSVYTTVQTNSSSNWDNNLVTTYVNNNFLPINGGTLTGNLSVLGDLVYVDTSVAVVSTMYIDTNTILDPALRITQRGTGDVIRIEDAANPDSTPFIINSDGLVGIGTASPNKELTVIGNVSATGSYYGDGSNLTGIVAGDTVATTLVRSNSGFWQNTYTNVQTNSANWQSTYSTVSSLSASWQTTFTASSAYVSSNPTGITGASALTKLLQITQAGYNAITPASDTLYIIVG
jgi:hypothetical protein